MSLIKDNIENIKMDLPENVKLIVVSKTRRIDEMDEAYDAGERDFGENKVQELLSKYDSFHKDVNWHLIGHLQRNKVKYIVGKTFLIHSLDSIELLEEIERRYSKVGKTAQCLIQINIGEESSKTGVNVHDLMSLIKAVSLCKYTKIKGLMAIIPVGDDESCKHYFRQMKDIFANLKMESYPNITMEYLSMGMTGDYKMAVLEGANMIRIGEGIFGKRI